MKGLWKTCAPIISLGNVYAKGVARYQVWLRREAFVGEMVEGVSAMKKHREGKITF